MLKFILTLILIILVLRSLARLLMPLMVSEVVKKAQRNMDNQYRNQQNPNREGDIHVDYAPPKAKKRFSFTKSSGDFVDYEEIKK